MLQTSPQSSPPSQPGERSTTSPVRVLCVDDNHLVREALRAKLGRAEGFALSGELDCADSLVDEVGRNRPDVVLLDVDMPGEDPLQAMERLQQLHPGVRVIIFSGHIRRDLVDAALERGAWGYLSKSDSSLRVEDAIRRVLANEVVLCEDVRETLRG